MIEELNQKIDKEKEVLDTLPKNNKKNIKAYKEEVLNIYNNYKEYKSVLDKELKKRKKKVNNISINLELENSKKKLKDIEDKLYLFTNTNTSYEKSNLDKNIYYVSKYYKYSLDKVNEDILEIIKTFSSLGINLTSKDFYYSKYLKIYIDALLNNLDILDTFENIYWKCSDILTHAELNFKSLYLKNKNVFDKHYLVKKNNLLKDTTCKEIFDDYKIKRKKLDKDIFKDEETIYNLFKDRVLNVNDFKMDTIKKSYQNIFNKDYNDIDIDDVIKYYYALGEYMDYLNITYIIDDAKKLLNEKNNYKSNIKAILKDIKKYESKLVKINRVIEKLDNKNKDSGKYIILQNSIINKLKELYDNLSNSNLLDRLYEFLNNDTTYNEVIEIYYNNYLYLARLIKSLNEEVTMDEINNSINNLRNIYYSPYKTFLESSLLGEEKDIKLVFSDCYSLVSYNINTDLLDNYDDISALRDSIYKIIIYYYINMLGINIEDIEFFSIID